MNDLMLEKFGNMMDKFLEETPVQMVITMPENTIVPEIEDNLGMGPTMQFYILLNALEKVLGEVIAAFGEDEIDKEGLVDGLLELVKNDVLMNAEGSDEGATD